MTETRRFQKSGIAAKSFISIIEKIIRLVIFLSVGFMLFFICLQVFFRFGLNNALSWPEEAAVFLMIWFSYLGAVYVQRERGHIRLVFFYEKFSEKNRLILDIIFNGCIIVFLAIVLKEGIFEAISLKSMETSALRISKAIPYLSIPVFSLLFIAVNLLLIVKDAERLLKLWRSSC